MQTLDPLSTVDVVLWLDDQKVQARAEIVCKHPNLGNGIKFVRMGESDKEKLKNFLEKAQKTRGLPSRRPGF
jgi:hypothetical protein